MSNKAADKEWAALNKKLVKAMKGNDWDELKMTYFDMAMFCYDEGRSFFHLLEEARKAELRGYQQSPVVTRVSIMTSKSGSCAQCVQLHGKKYSIEDALETMPIPVKDCAMDLGTGGGWCRCVYTPLIE